MSFVSCKARGDGAVWDLSFRSAFLSREEFAVWSVNSRFLTGLSARFGMTRLNELRSEWPSTMGSGGRDSHPFAKSAKEWGTLSVAVQARLRKPEVQCFGSKGTLISMVVLALAGAYFHFWTAEAADSPR